MLDKSVRFHNWQIWRNRLVYVVETGTPAGTIEILDLETHRTQVHTTVELDPGAATAERPFWGLAVSPDGRFILISQLDIAGSDLMLAENYR